MRLTVILTCAAAVQAQMFGNFFNQMLKKEFSVEESWHNQEYHKGEWWEWAIGRPIDSRSLRPIREAARAIQQLH